MIWRANRDRNGDTGSFRERRMKRCVAVSFPFTITVTRSGLTTGISTMNYAVTGSATNGANAADFLARVFPTGVLSFIAGETKKTITLRVLGELVGEANEGSIVTLSTPGTGTITTSTATGTITNDD